MYLKQIELSGFKSFAKKSTLEFNTPVTAIVGPNGSGKSNVVESIRFVLGEQSMKSLRGKTGSDLIFKGSRNLSKLNRASVTITFDNTKKVFSLATLQNSSIKLDFNEISITREVFADGANKYLINGSEVRLKDVHELMSSVNIGSSGHHIISQGEADRILNASSRDRRGMIEDALGLKIFQYRLKDSERKLERTKLNIKEAQSLRREIAPHITFLKKQVEKIEKAEEMRNELLTLSLGYLKQEELMLSENKKSFIAEHDELSRFKSEVHKELKEVEEIKETTISKETIEIEETERKLQELRTLKDDISRKLGRVEGVIEFEERKASRGPSVAPEDRIIKTRTEISGFTSGIISEIDRILGVGTIEEAKPFLMKIKMLCQNFIPKKTEENTLEEESSVDLSKIREDRDQIIHELDSLKNKERELYRHVDALKIAIQSLDVARREKESTRFELMMRKNELENRESLLMLKEESFKAREARFLEEIKEISALTGPRVLEYKTYTNEEISTQQSQEEVHKKIERIKIKLEDAGLSGGSEVLKEYQEVSERDQFLVREIEDLTKSMEDIETLIRDLKIKLDTEFKTGIDKINKQFQSFFALMFGGGNAFLSVIVEQKRKRKTSDEDDELEILEEVIAEEEVFEQGIDINISLPQKKVKELTMLSGGERSLTSIALLFAISQVNPPPFLVLDETDAALDESNSRKYGDMIETLAEYSQLVVVTHNRETMSRAHVLYGVTLGADGGSKLLSVRFDEAVAIAK